MRIVFLDVDGVLNSKQYLAPLAGQPKSWEDWIDPDAVELLNDFPLFVPDVQFVLSSAWRQAHTVVQMQALLDGKGFDGDLVASTPVHDEGPRSGEIRAWLKDNPEVADYVVLDDMDDAGWGIQKHFVQTNPQVGLTGADVSRAIEVLLGY